jgi:hypothetical protein
MMRRLRRDGPAGAGDSETRDDGGAAIAQVFHPFTNTISRMSIVGTLAAIVAVIWAFGLAIRSPYVTEVGVARDQPVPFSHKHHVGGLGLDCRFCHTGVETSSFAGIPPTKTCMTCHSQIWADSPMLEPVRTSYRTDRPLQWTRVHDLPDFAFFNHSIHVNKGIGCTTCHGNVQEMPLMWRDATLNMEWCLDCHRQPQRYVRPRDQVFSVDWKPPPDQLEVGAELVQRYGIKVSQLTNCTVCHR